ncbi:MAG: isocitrate lyase/phosphoenolpyruvate mutase family protein [Saprospiraceae bacterium]|nr:isocitrate lyase/phosphoenolpyruvate mutase family protein [Saprospiraceae bacterium]
MTSFSAFTQFHQQDRPLLIGNVWNVQSVRVFEKIGFQALATSSAAMAHALGYEDGQQLPFSELIYLINRIVKCTHLPLSVDLESGYGETSEEIIENIRVLHKMGVVGINLEDSKVENGERKLLDGISFSILLKKITSSLKNENINVFVNVRCDAFLIPHDKALTMAIKRIDLYEKAGADGIFLPGIISDDDIRAVVSSTQLPINVMCMPALPDFKVLTRLGVKRISMGNWVHDKIYETMEKIVDQIKNQQSFQPLF